jgi:hypothetical protein
LDLEFGEGNFKFSVFKKIIAQQFWQKWIGHSNPADFIQTRL